MRAGVPRAVDSGRHFVTVRRHVLDRCSIQDLVQFADDLGLTAVGYVSARFG